MGSFFGWLRFGRASRPLTLTDKIRAIKIVFNDVDRQVHSFQSQTHLSCPPRCGHCCVNPQIETTTLEMLPMAEDVIRRGQVDVIWRKAEAQGFSGRCIFYQPEPDNIDRGRCGAYEFRPLICRLFGFAGNRDKHGRPRLSVCTVMKKDFLQQIDQVTVAIEQKRAAMPVMTQVMMRAASIDPDIACKSMPINTALKNAIEQIELARKYQQSK